MSKLRGAMIEAAERALAGHSNTVSYADVARIAVDAAILCALGIAVGEVGHAIGNDSVTVALDVVRGIHSGKVERERTEAEGSRTGRMTGTHPSEADVARAERARQGRIDPKNLPAGACHHCGSPAGMPCPFGAGWGPCPRNTLKSQ